MIDLHAAQRTLNPLPPLSETSGYRVVRGDPKASIRFELGAAGSMLRMGFWNCTEGAFECTESGDELQTLLKGRLRVIESDGTVHEYQAGDSFFTRQGEVVTWDIVEEVEKVFFTYIRGGDGSA